MGNNEGRVCYLHPTEKTLPTKGLRADSEDVQPGSFAKAHESWYWIMGLVGSGVML